MEELINSFDALDGILKTFWVCAIVSSLIFIIQFVMTFVGVGDADIADFDSVDTLDGSTMDAGGMLSLFSVRGLVNFLMGFGWGGICAAHYTASHLVMLLCAISAGVIFVVVFFVLMKYLMKLESNGSLNMNDCLGRNCDVYLRIPAAKSGKGKVQICINGTVLEFDAMTDDKELIPTGQRVKVVALIGNSLLLVERV